MSDGSTPPDQQLPGTHMEGKLSREVIHATGVHEAQGVADGFAAQHALACDRTNASVGKSGSHHTSGLTVHLDGAQLEGGESQAKREITLVCLS